jgi:PiT family inorganic phosphate transporter
LITRVGLPISTTHALVGGLTGAGFTLEPGQLSWSALGGSCFLPLLVSPVLAFGFVSLIYALAHQTRRILGIDAGTCVCIGESRDPVRQTPAGAWFVERTGLELTVDQVDTCRDFYVGEALGVSVQTIVNRAHQISAFLLGSPVSTTHVSTGSLFGIGLWNKTTNWKMVSGIVAAWFGTLPVAAGLAAAAAYMLQSCAERSTCAI